MLKFPFVRRSTFNSMRREYMRQRKAVRGLWDQFVRAQAQQRYWADKCAGLMGDPEKVSPQHLAEIITGGSDQHQGTLIGILGQIRREPLKGSASWSMQMHWAVEQVPKEQVQDAYFLFEELAGFLKDRYHRPDNDQSADTKPSGA